MLVRSARLLTIVRDCGVSVGSHCAISQLGGQLSLRSRFPSSQLSGRVMFPSPHFVQKFVQPSFVLSLPSSHSSPASTVLLPHIGGLVVVVVETGVVVVVTTVEVVVVVVTLVPPMIISQLAMALSEGST